MANGRLEKAKLRVLAEQRQVAKDIRRLASAKDPELIARLTRDLIQKQKRLASALMQLSNAQKGG